MQCLWIYDREVSLDRLTRTCDRLAELSVNRLIEPSPLPFGRPRWVRAEGAAVPVFEPRALRPRQELMRWADACAHTPIDPVNGPAWHLTVQRFDDGTTAVSLVASHLLFDGMAAMRAIETAVGDTALRSDYQRRGERRPAIGALADLRQAVADAPRTLAAAGRLAAARLGERRVRAEAGPAATLSAADARQVVPLVSVAALIDEEAWNRRAFDLHGHPVLLLPAVTARIAAHMGRLRPSDGSASLVMPVDRRGDDRDDRALAIAFAQLGVDPERARTDLRQVEAAVKAGLRESRQAPDALERLLPMVAWMPQRATRAIIDGLFSYADQLHEHRRAAGSGRLHRRRAVPVPRRARRGRQRDPGRSSSHTRTSGRGRIALQWDGVCRRRSLSSWWRQLHGARA